MTPIIVIEATMFTAWRKGTNSFNRKGIEERLIIDDGDVPFEFVGKIAGSSTVAKACYVERSSTGSRHWNNDRDLGDLRSVA